MEKIQKQVLSASCDEQINILREHILNSSFEELGANAFDIYIVAYVAENIDTGKEPGFLVSEPMVKLTCY